MMKNLTYMPKFSQRSIQIANLLLNGCENEDIAKELNITVRTVKSHMNRMFREFNIHRDGGIKRVKLAIQYYRLKKAGRVQENCLPKRSALYGSSTMVLRTRKLGRPRGTRNTSLKTTCGPYTTSSGSTTGSKSRSGTSVTTAIDRSVDRSVDCSGVCCQ